MMQRAHQRQIVSKNHKAATLQQVLKMHNAGMQHQQLRLNAL
jgi:hypothetical protein